MNNNHNATILAAAFGEDAATTISLYDILGIDKDATAAQLRKAYYRKSLTCHPDKVGPGKESMFQAITVAYNILKTPESRQDYDETGVIVDDDNDNDDDNDAFNGNNSFDAMKNYFQTIFGTVTTSKIDLFAEKYKCSSEEEEDVLNYFRQFKGNLLKVLENVMVSSERDATRWVHDYIQPAMEAGTVPSSPSIQKTMERTLAQCIQKVEGNTATATTATKSNGNKKAKSTTTKSKSTIMEVEVDDDETESDATESDDHTEEEEEVKPSRTKKVAAAANKKKAPAKKKTQPASKKKAQSKAQQREAQEAEAFMAKIQGRKTQVARKQDFDAMLGGLAAKYGGKASATSNDDDDPLDDEAFARIQSKLKKKKRK